jgi:phosphoribosylanthranilate isomerase
VPVRYAVTWVKICGITNLEDAEVACAAGADALGLNLIPESKRYLTPEVAREVAAEFRGRLEIVGVVANRATEELEALIESIGLDGVQLHGEESAEDVRALLPRAYKVVAIAGPEDVRLAENVPGERLLLDTKVEGMRGGTGMRFDWRSVTELAGRRRVIVAGGLTPANVAEAVSVVKPYGVDVASGVEVTGSPRRKDATLVRAFVAAAKAASGDGSG